MATIKVFDCNGVKELKCFDTLVENPYIVPAEEIFPSSEDSEDGE